VLTSDALAFVADLARKFDGKRRELLDRRAQRQKDWDAGGLPDVLPGTRSGRDGGWTSRGVPDDR
ncbi:MAG: malate synthase A, partial [Hyphomicrobiales bacterium]